MVSPCEKIYVVNKVKSSISLDNKPDYTITHREQFSANQVKVDLISSLFPATSVQFCRAVSKKCVYSGDVTDLAVFVLFFCFQVKHQTLSSCKIRFDLKSTHSYIFPHLYQYESITFKLSLLLAHIVLLDLCPVGGAIGLV